MFDFGKSFPQRPGIYFAKGGIYFAKVGLAISYLSAVFDRFGFWGHLGETGVSWGSMTQFFKHVSILCPWAPENMIPVIGWVVTVLEAVIALSYIINTKNKIINYANIFLLILFIISMSIFQSIKMMINFNVIVCFALSLLIYFADNNENKEKRI